MEHTIVVVLSNEITPEQQKRAIRALIAELKNEGQRRIEDELDVGGIEFIRTIYAGDDEDRSPPHLYM